MKQEVTKSFIDLMREGRALTEPLHTGLFRAQTHGRPLACALGAAMYAFDAPRLQSWDDDDFSDDFTDTFGLRTEVTVDPAQDPDFADKLMLQGLWFPGRPFTRSISTLVMHLNDTGRKSTEQIIDYLLLNNVPEIQLKRTFLQELIEVEEIANGTA